MRTPLLLSSLLLFSACSDNTPTQTTTITEPVKVIRVERNDTTPKQVVKNSATQTVAPINGHSIYAHKCASCHGQQGEKIALNTSSIIAGWKSQKTIEVLTAYKKGDYGKKLKGVMKAQAKALNDAQIKAVAEYIATL